MATREFHSEQAHTHHVVMYKEDGRETPKERVFSDEEEAAVFMTEKNGWMDIYTVDGDYEDESRITGPFSNAYREDSDVDG